jgi:hypothetical protein
MAGFLNSLFLMNLIVFFSFGVSLLVSLNLMAETINQKVTLKSFKGYKITKFPKNDLPSEFTKEEINKYLPSQLVATDSSQTNLRKISDRAMQVWIKSPMMQQFSFVQSARMVEKAMKTEVDFGGGDLDPDSDAKQIQHKVNFQVQAFQALSKVDYKGYVNASLTYNLRDQKTGLEIREKILRNKDLYVIHSTSRSENLSAVGIKWDF